MNVLAFFAHPDDETMLAGGTLALLARAGANMHYLCATRGEGGEMGEPPVCTLEQLGETRQAEMACAVQELGGGRLDFLDYVDPRVGPGDVLYPYTEDIDSLAAQVRSAVEAYRIDAVLTHGADGEYGHPAHVLSHRAARRAVDSLQDDVPMLFCVQADFEGHPKPRLANPGQPAHLVLDIGPVLENKIQAALCHRSQHALFVRRSSEAAGRQMTVPEVILGLESLHRLYPAVNGKLDDPLAAFLMPNAYPVSSAS
jgi:LmbE family N-acetylglucosaminyl deacetylase